MLKIESPVDDGLHFTTEEVLVDDLTTEACGSAKVLQGTIRLDDAGSRCNVLFSHDDEQTFMLCPGDDPARFDVEITDTVSPVVGGQPVEVTATVENTGGQAGSQAVDLPDEDGELLRRYTRTLGMIEETLNGTADASNDADAASNDVETGASTTYSVRSPR
ncbi:hypothetical protein BRC81_02775 [Halobacteriales archaeon QS_1_68_20]|nr:MAG: hypothetical protein BRC81_02775 [Halobacteriales archaeon QS_1_68_20]